MRPRGFARVIIPRLASRGYSERCPEVHRRTIRTEQLRFVVITTEMHIAPKRDDLRAGGNDFFFFFFLEKRNT